MIDKYESRKIRAEIRNVFMDVWDPIGVRSLTTRRDEYDGYIGMIYEMLIGGRSDEEILARLLWIERERMGLTSGGSNIKRANNYCLTRDQIAPAVSWLSPFVLNQQLAVARLRVKRFSVCSTSSSLANSPPSASSRAFLIPRSATVLDHSIREFLSLGSAMPPRI
jgi:hypothetical protein